MKKVLVLCTGNSCRSIIAEALINARLPLALAVSAGSAPKGHVHPFAQEVLRRHGIWRPDYRSKSIEEVQGPFDLVVTVCDNAREACPVWSGVRSIHLPFMDPDGQGYEAFERTLRDIEEKLLPKIKKELDA